MKLTLTALTVAATMFASGVYAADPANGPKLRDTNACVSCDLTHADLFRADMEGADLRYADMEGADLRYAEMEGADLRGTNLKGADLFGADLTGSDLTGSDMEGAILSSAILSSAKLRYTNMNGIILCNTTMPDGSVIYSGC